MSSFTTNLQKSISRNDDTIYFGNEYGEKISSYQERQTATRIFAPTEEGLGSGLEAKGVPGIQVSGLAQCIDDRSPEGHQDAGCRECCIGQVLRVPGYDRHQKLSKWSTDLLDSAESDIR